MTLDSLDVVRLNQLPDHSFGFHSQLSCISFLGDTLRLIFGEVSLLDELTILHRIGEGSSELQVSSVTHINMVECLVRVMFDFLVHILEMYDEPLNLVHTSRHIIMSITGL